MSTGAPSPAIPGEKRPAGLGCLYFLASPESSESAEADGWKFNLAVEDVHGGETEAMAALGSVVLAKVSREKESRAVCSLLGLGQLGGLCKATAPYQGALSAGGVGLDWQLTPGPKLMTCSRP